MRVYLSPCPVCYTCENGGHPMTISLPLDGTTKASENGGLMSRLASIAIVALAGAVVLTGCTRTSPFSQAPVQATPRQPAPLQPAPTAQVNEGQLAPVTREPTPPPQNTALPAPEPIPAEPTPEPVQVASAETSASSNPLTRKAVLGFWDVNPGGSDCKVFLNLTPISKGYRGGKVRCQSSVLNDLRSWDVVGGKLVLYNGSGNTIATLSKNSVSKLSGTADIVGSIAFTRES